MGGSLEDRTIKRLKNHFYIHVSVIIVLFLLIYFKIIPLPDYSASIGLTVQTYTIMFTLVALPGSLKLYSVNIKKKQTNSIEKTTKYFRKIFFQCLYIVAFTVIINMLLFGFTRVQNYGWLALISFMTYAFCMPREDDLYNLLPKATESEETDKTE